MSQSKILCAAILIKNYDEHGDLLIAGHRHHDCFTTFARLSGERLPATNYEYDQGFLTSAGRFVDRKKAVPIAIRMGITPRNPNKLYSEDLYTRSLSEVDKSRIWVARTLTESLENLRCEKH